MADSAPQPPWLNYPQLSRYSIGWRMGSGEDYIHTWHEWADGQTQDALIDYFEQHRPPQEWFDFVADRLYPDVAGNDIETAITMLADQYAWVDLEAWRKCSDKLLGSE